MRWGEWEDALGAARSLASMSGRRYVVRKLDGAWTVLPGLGEVCS